MMMMTMMTNTIPYRRTKTHIWDKVLMGFLVHPLVMIMDMILLWIWLQNSTSGVVVHLAIFFLTDIGVAWIFIFLRKISLVTFCWVGQSCAICWDVPAIKARIGVNSRKRNNARVEKLHWEFYFMKAKSLTIFFTQAEIEKKICQISCTMHISTSDQVVDCPTKPICT